MGREVDEAPHVRTEQTLGFRGLCSFSLDDVRSLNSHKQPACTELDPFPGATSVIREEALPTGRQARLIELTPPEKPTIVLADDGTFPWYQPGSLAHPLAEIKGWLKKKFGTAEFIDQPKTLKGMIDALLEQSKRTGKPLGDIIFQCHGSENGTIWIGDQAYKLDTPELLREFARLKKHLAPGATIEFQSCQTGSGDNTQKQLQDLANATGARIVAYKWYQLAFYMGVGPSVSANPQPEAHHHRKKYPA